MDEQRIKWFIEQIFSDHKKENEKNYITNKKNHETFQHIIKSDLYLN